MKTIDVMVTGAFQQSDQLIQYPKQSKEATIESMQEISRHIRQQLEQILIIVNNQKKGINQLKVSSLPPKK